MASSKCGAGILARADRILLAEPVPEPLRLSGHSGRIGSQDADTSGLSSHSDLRLRRCKHPEHLGIGSGRI